jgi:hypothetical protein
MAGDLSTVPRRLRRFHRKGIPVPKEMLEQRSSKEPFFEKKTGELKRPFRKERHIGESRAKNIEPSAKPGLFSKIFGKGKQKPKAMDRALGLKHVHLEETLPGVSEQAIQSKPSPNPAVQRTLERLKKLKSGEKTEREEKSTWKEKREKFRTEENKQTSFHLTNSHALKKEEDLKKEEEKTKISPRERMEQRRKEREQKREKEKGKEMEKEESEKEQPVSREHYRRRGGRIEEEREGMGIEEEEKPVGEESFDEEEFSVKDLFASKPKEEKKKKKTKSDGELESMEDFALLEDE